MAAYQRIFVDCIEGDLLYGHSESTGGIVVSLRPLRNKDADHRYLAPLVACGSQINVVDCEVCDAVCYPRLIILEPDYLVDVSAIAACCESYGNTHLRVFLCYMI